MNRIAFHFEVISLMVHAKMIRKNYDRERKIL